MPVRGAQSCEQNRLVVNSFEEPHCTSEHETRGFTALKVHRAKAMTQRVPGAP